MRHDNPSYFPICLSIAGRRCIVIGGGRVGERKALALLAHGAKVRVISPELSRCLAALAEAGQVEWLARAYQPGDLADAFLVIAATDDTAVQEAVHAEAEAANLLLNVADVPKWCNFILPATARRGDLAISVSTAGKSPALAKQLRQELEGRFGPEYAAVLEILGALREVVLAEGRPHAENKKRFARLADPAMAAWIKAGQWEKVRGHLRAVLGPEAPLACVETVRERYSNQSGTSQ
ncbi:MAG: precorrin-2 dehydrogenase/sirohydrochlorin ferrochelatase family protein [Thermodesulfobacteriota bacterium]